MKKFVFLLLMILLGWIICSAHPQTVGVYTRAFDNSRSGVNSKETTLTQTSIASKGLRLLTTIPLIGDARGMEAQPLLLPNVKLVDGSTHDILVLPSMANIIRGVDARTGASIWQTPQLGMPITGGPVIDFHNINQHWGCLSTGVIDPDTQLLYQVCWVSEDKSGTPQSGRYHMLVLSVKDGTILHDIPVQGTDTSMWKQRSSLVMTNVNGVKTVFFAHGSVYEVADGFTGGIIAFDVATNTVSAYLPLTSGVWMAGQGLSADSQGRLYFITGNGDFDPSKGWYGESFLRVTYTPQSSSSTATLKVAPGDVWSPWTDYQRTGQAVMPNAKLAGMSMPSEAVKPVGGGMNMSMANAKVVGKMNAQNQPVSLVYPVMAKGNWSDEDWGSAGPACIFDLNVCIAAGKDGIGYPISTKNLGGTTLATAGTQSNYAKLAAPCVWLTMSPGNIPCAPSDPRTLNFFPNGDTAHLHMTPVQMYTSLKFWNIFVWGENQQLHEWRVNPNGSLSYVAQSHEFASVDVRGNPPGGMPGGFCSGSSNGVDPDSALIACSIPYGDANATLTSGRLLIYDAVHLASDGYLKVLWDSQQWGIPYQFNKFMPPIIANGLIYLPNYNGGVMVFGQ